MEARRSKREELLMQRRGLNFITDAVADNLDEEQVSTLEGEVDNVAPKIVGILGLSGTCDVRGLRQEMVRHCVEHRGGEIGDIDDVFRAYICPNPGSSTNMGSKKQRLIFLEMDRND